MHPKFALRKHACLATLFVARKAIHLEVCLGDTTEVLMDRLFKHIRARPPHLTFCKKKVKAGLYLFGAPEEGPRPLSKRALQLQCAKNRAAAT